ncbi:MAG TPA: cell division protein FtsZ [Ktedonobacteraceae bacterium]|nr:cell division protein FtsZ [Ktedonobacteraceae bacterium]
MQSRFHENAKKREQTPKQQSGMARPRPDVYAEQDDQWAVLRHEVEVEDMRWQEQQEGVDWEWDQRDTGDDALSSQDTYNELEEAESQVDIVVVGVGGAGMNAVNRMIDTHVRGVRFIAMNTDAQVLSLCEAPDRICLGQHYTKGLGAGGVASVGARAAMESSSEIRAALGEADLVFIAAGMGGGTGTGGAPVVASIAKKMGALTVGIVTLPFSFEGTRRRRSAEEGLNALCEEVDAIITVPNDRLLSIIGRDRTLSESFKVADDVLRQGVQGIAEVINVPGLVNVDFADVRSVLREAGTALMSIGQGKGRNRAQHAAEEAIAGGLLNVPIRGARRVLFNISGGEDMTLFEVNEVAEQIGSAIHDAADITFGAVIDPSLNDMIRVTLIAAGMPEAQTGRVPIIHLEQPVTPPPSSTKYSSNRLYNPPVAPGANPVPRQPPRNVQNTPQERAQPTPPQAPVQPARPPVQPARPPVQPGKPPVKTPRPVGRPQRSLDDLRGLRSMGRRQEAQRSGSQSEEGDEIEMPPFLRRYE